MIQILLHQKFAWMKRKLEKSNRNITDIADILDASPVRFQLKKKKINDVSTPTKSYLLKKFHEATTLLKTKICRGFSTWTN